MKEVGETKQEAIQALRAYGFSQTACRAILDVGQGTVDKYEGEDAKRYESNQDYATKEWENITAALPEHIEPEEVVHDDFIPADYVSGTGDTTRDDPFEDKTDERLRVSENPEEMTPGEWLEKFFEELEVGIKSKFITIQSRRADRKQELPDQDKMESDLKNMPSGAKGETANYIAEEYWHAAQEYISETQTSVFRGNNPGSSGGGSGEGGFVDVNQNQQQAGQWVTFPDGSRKYGRFVPDGQGGQRFEPMQPPGQQQQAGYGAPQQQQGANPEVQAIRDELRELRSEMNGGGQDGLQEQVREMIQLQEALKELQADDASGADDAMQVLRQEMRALRQEMGGNQQTATGDNPRERLLNRVLMSEDVDESTAMDMLERFEGQTDPEIRELEIEKQMKEKEMEQKQQRTEKMMSALEDVASTAATAFANQLREADDDDDNAGGNPQPQQTQQQPRQQPQQQQYAPDGAAPPQQSQQMELWDCPECGASTEQNPALPGRRCGECDFSVTPCPECQKPIEIPPQDEREGGGCPECGGQVATPNGLDGNATCIECAEWTGDAREAVKDTVECDSCGAEHGISPDPGA